MITVERSIEIDRPVEEVFDYLCDVERLPEWQSTVSAVRPEGPVATGTRIHDVREFLGRRTASMLEVSRHERPERFSLRVVEGPVKYEIDHTLAEVDGRARVTVSGRAHLPRLFGLAARPMVKAAERQLETDLRQLKAVLEAGSS